MGLMDRPATAVVDIDGVIATGTKEEVYSEEAKWAYERCDPIPEGIRMVNRLKSYGLRVVFHTARFPEDEDVTRRWLNLHGIPFDELIMGKPQGEIYIDDKGFHYRPGFTRFDKIMEQMVKTRQYEFEEDLI